MNRKLLLVGGGGHCKSILDTLYRIGEYQDIAIIDKKENIGKNILETPIIGTDDDLKNLYIEGYKEAFISIGTITNFNTKIKLVNHLHKIGFYLPNIIDPTAIISNYCEIGKGIFVGKSAIVNANTKLEDFSIINSQAICEHDVTIEKYTHIAPGSVILAMP
ncbi:hypothetical protein J416_02069 [Gracilibacillus halophilus YIM-C55.5]|uniref:PglD N-terminal domain-containing protein n=1 Tax=Gracilibacillus halophilus YIM-C55.5 TaxID=1308866 RepID=N4WPT2_9BACI|nr:hypothetical protein [Gracilibacillus halophilus]ENH98112.1 hypothetical protein J416_02069 [Gracilibacillus halophilus YIM-C55.5]